MELGKTGWDETGCSVDAWNPFQTRVKLVLLCSVDRALDAVFFCFFFFVCQFYSNPEQGFGSFQNGG